MSNSEAVAAMVIVAMVSACFLVAVCLRGTAPTQRPAILRALGDVLRSLWPL